MTASMVARASRLGPRLLAAVASARLPEWPADRVLAYALTLPREGDRGAAIAEIWGLLPARERDRLYRPVLEWIDVNPFPHSRARAYAAWLRHLDASAVRFIVREVAAQSGEHWRDSDSFMDPRWEVDVAGAVRLAALGATDEAVDMIMTLPEQYHWDSPRRDGLEAIASSLPADACRRVLEIERERSPESRAWSAAIVAGRMAALGHLDEAMALARTVDPVPPSQPPLMDGPDARVQAYRHVLAPERTWERETRLAAEREALALVDTASGAEWGVSAACIAGVLRAHDPASLTRQILDLAPERMSRELYLKQIVPFLPEPARHEALLEWLDDTATQRSVLHGHTLMGYIRWLVPMWSPDHLNELTGLVGGDVCLEDRWEFDLAVAVRQGGAGSGRILRRVVRDRVTIGDIDGRQRATDALRGLATEPVSEAEPVATECRSRLAEIVELESPCERVEKLRGLAPSLGAHWDDVADDVIDLVAGLTPETVRAEAALVVAVALAPGQREALVELAVSSLRADAPQADDERPPVRALAGRPLTGRAEVEALESSTWFLAHVVSTGMHAPTIARRAWQLAGTLDGPEREGIATALLEFARSLGDPHRIDVAALAIRDLPPHARSVAADELRGWARTIDGDPYGRAVAFAAAAVADPPAPRWDDVRAAVALLDGLTPYEQMRVVAWLTRHRSAAAFEEVLDALEGLPRGQAQAEALETAILSSPPGSWDRIMQLIAAIDYPEVELILLHEAITVAPEPVRTQCRSRVATLLRAIDPITAGSRIREHVIALLPVLEPHDAAAALGFLWQSLAGQARSELLEVVARTATDMRLIDEGLTEALAENVELAARWLP